MPDNSKEPKFESIGTIHYRASSEGNRLFFVPESNHSLKYSGTSYAVFVSVCQPTTAPDNKDADREALAVPLRNNEGCGIFIEKSVPIEIPKCCGKMRDVLQVALQAAENDTKVTVRVKKKPGCSVAELVGITFPAR